MAQRRIQRNSLTGQLGEAFTTSLVNIAKGKHVQMKAKAFKLLMASRFDVSEINELVIPHRTLARRLTNDEALTQEETDKALRLARIVKEADRVFGSSEKADDWLRRPLIKFADQAPLDLLKTEAGAFLVEETLGQIDHGIFA